jgi:hypothetical protein
MMERHMKAWLTPLFLLCSGMAVAQTPSAAASGATQPMLQAQMSDPAAQPVKPSGPPPSDVIPPAPENPAPPTNQEGVVTPEAQTATGQWVYTGQYGWVWMPYGNAYTYVPPGGGSPDMYVYYPSVGWTWVVAPWIWGWGPMPYFGYYGTVGFGWYGYGYGHWYGYAGPYAGWYGRGYWNGGHWVGGYHPAGPRGGYAPPGGGVHTGGYAAPHGGGGMSFGGGHGGGGHR